jgi:hypothetical protein
MRLQKNVVERDNMILDTRKFDRVILILSFVNWLASSPARFHFCPRLSNLVTC